MMHIQAMTLRKLLQLCVLAMLMFAPVALSKELVPAKPAAEESGDKKSQVVQPSANAQATAQLPSGERNDKQTAPANDDNQLCEDDNCQPPQNAGRSSVPLGARISDALTRQDREAATEILEHERILLNDEMNLLFMTGRSSEAADIGFTLLERSSLDESLYEQVAPILMAHSRHSGFMTTFHAFDSYNAMNYQVNTYGHQLGSVKVDFLYFQETRSNVKTESLNSAPDESGGELAFNQGGDSYANILKIQFSQALNTQTGFSITHQHKAGSRLKLEAQIARNQTATENAALRLMGRADQLALESAYSLDSYSQWILGLMHSRYSSIEGQELGSGNLITTTLSHELSGVRPALHTRITGSWNRFQIADTNLSGLAASLIPPGESNSAAYFMPQDVNEVAAYIRLGDNTESTLPARDLEAFLELGAFNNQSAGSGWRASAGVAGRAIGADRLHMFIRYDQSPNGQEFSSLEAGLAYLLHY